MCLEVREGVDLKVGKGICLQVRRGEERVSVLK